MSKPDGNKNNIVIPIDDAEPSQVLTPEDEQSALCFLLHLVKHYTKEAVVSYDSGVNLGFDLEYETDENSNIRNLSIVQKDSEGRKIKKFDYELIGSSAYINIEEVLHFENTSLYNAYGLEMDISSFTTIFRDIPVHRMGLSGGEELERENEYIPLRVEDLPGYDALRSQWNEIIRGYYSTTNDDIENMAIMIEELFKKSTCQ